MKNKQRSLVGSLALLACVTAWSQSCPRPHQLPGTPGCRRHSDAQRRLRRRGQPLRRRIRRCRDLGTPNFQRAERSRTFGESPGSAGLFQSHPRAAGYRRPRSGPIFAANGSLFIELKVGGGSLIAPRQQMLAAPYALQALNAANAAKLGGFDWTSLFAGGNPQTGNMGVGVARPKSAGR